MDALVGLMAPFAISILLSGVQSSTRMHSKLYADPMPSWGGHRFYASFNIGFNLIYRDDNADVNSLVLSPNFKVFLQIKMVIWCWDLRMKG